MTRLISRCGVLCLLALLWAALILAAPASAGGPKYVAGTSYFAPPVTGHPLVWPNGQISYYTDQGDLSPVLPSAAADQFVAAAFAVWTSPSTAAIAVNQAGHLAEDVTGTNLTISSTGTITAPLDIAPSATGTPVGIVYDLDGSVTNALLGSGAGDASECFWNAAFGGADNFSADAGIQHALVVINGQCAQQSSQFTDVQYRLIRVLGRILGVGYSQLNLNVITGNPPATPDDLAGFPLMHFLDEISCVPITACLPNPLQLAPDDISAVSRLYPVTAENLPNFPNGQIFSSTTGRIHGSVWFTDFFGQATTAMQGVNVVARWIDPATGKPSRSVAASSLSGFLFTGNAGNRSPASMTLWACHLTNGDPRTTLWRASSIYPALSSLAVPPAEPSSSVLNLLTRSGQRAWVRMRPGRLLPPAWQSQFCSLSVQDRTLPRTF